MSHPNMDIVLVPSTLCNLRCSYCYELSVLADKRRMTHDALAVVFERLGAYFQQHSVPSARFIWHGGEPLLLPPEFYWRAFELQRSAFAGLATRTSNVVQTNLTVMDQERRQLLRSGFDAAGVSLDLFGSLRVDAAGRGREQVALANLDALLADGLVLGGVTVLTRANRARVKRIYDFYRQRDMAFRILPLHAGDFESGQWFEIAPADTLRALCLLADTWLTDPGAPPVHPVVGVIKDVYHYHVEGRAVPRYEKRMMFGIDREGYVNSFEEYHDRSKSYGCLLDSPLDALLQSEQHRRAERECQARVARACSSCPHFAKTCSSYPMAEGTRDYWDVAPDGGVHCTAFAGLIEHVTGRLQAAGVLGATAQDSVAAYRESEQRLDAKQQTWRLLG